MLPEVNIQDLEKAIGLDVRVVLEEDEDERSIRVCVKLEATTQLSVDKFVLARKGFSDEVLWSTVARQLKLGLMAHLFTLLEDNDSPDLASAKAVARREGFTRTVDRNAWL